MLLQTSKILYKSIITYQKEMKKFRLFISSMLCIAAALSLNSCINDDNKNTDLTPEEIQTAYNSVKGDYSGKVITSISTGVNDTAAVKWDFDNDSLLTIKNIPAKMLSYNISDAEIKKALADMPPFDLKCKIKFVRMSPATFIINPVTPAFNVTYGGKSHLLQISFYIYNNYSYGQYYVDGKSLMMQAIAAGAYVDGSLQNGLLKQETPMLFTGKKQ